MDELFELFIKERRYLHNLTEGTLHYYREVYQFFKDVGFDGSKESLLSAIIKFKERGTSTGAINTYIRGLNVFLKWLSKEHGHPDLGIIHELRHIDSVLVRLTWVALITFSASFLVQNKVNF